MARLTEAQRHQIARRFVRGEAARPLAAEFGISLVYVYNIARRRGKHRQKPSAVRRLSWLQKVKRLRASGKLTEFIFKAPN